MGTNNPEISIHIVGGRHDYRAIPFLHRHRKQAEEFFVPKDLNGQTKGLNVFVMENYAETDTIRGDFLALSGQYSLVEASIRSVFPDELRKVGIKEFDKRVARRIKERTELPQWQADYDYQRLIMLDDLKRIMDIQVDTEFHSSEESKYIVKQGENVMLKEQARAAWALSFGEADMAADIYLTALITEADLMRRRHTSILNLARDYGKHSRILGSPLRLLVSFGAGHVQGLTRVLDELLSDLNPNITSSYAEGELLSHHYDLVYQMEFDQEYKPSKREILVALLQAIFVNSPMVATHPLHHNYSYTQADKIIYALLDACSIEDIDVLVKAAAEVDFEEALVQLTGTGLHAEPFSGLPGVLIRSIRRINKLIVLKR